jgi:hypothetical protein
LLLNFKVIPINPYVIACDYLQKEFWASFKPPLQVLVHADMILLLLLMHQVGYEFGGNVMNVQIVFQNALN